MRIYARLFYNNVESFLANAFRVFRSITDDEQWHALVRGFLRGHRAESPYFSHIPEEFLQYLSDSSRQAEALAHSPWNCATTSG